LSQTHVCFDPVPLQGAWWNVLAERIQLWHKCFSAFMRQSPPVGSANFFLDITAKLEPDLFAREQLVLLSIARELLLIQHSTAQVTSSHEDHLEQLKVSLLLILTGTAPELTPDLELCPLDLSYKTICALVHRIPDQVNALPLYGMEGALMTSARANSSFGPGPAGPSAKEGQGQGGSVLDAQQKGPRGELIPFLETGISSLINRDELMLADQLASGFGYESSDQKLAAALSSIAGGKHLEAVHRLKSQQSPLEQGDAEPLLNELGSHCSHRIALYCRRCRVFYSVSRNIGMDYQEVEKVEPTKLLSLLLSPQPYCADIELCRNLITGFPRLDAVAVAEVLLDSFIESMLAQGVMRWAEEKLDEFVSLLSPSQELLGHAALQRIPSFRELVKTEHGPTTVPSQVLDPETEVEVLIMAYHSYVQGCRERSVSELLRLLQARAEFYVARGHFHLLVRLLVAIPEYHAMEYLFGHLVRHGELHTLLAEGRSALRMPRSADSTLLWLWP